MPASLPIGPTEETWRAMSSDEREQFLITVNDALAEARQQRQAEMIDHFTRKVEQAEAKIEQAKAKIEQAKAKIEEATSQAAQAQAKIEDALATSRENVLAILAARMIPCTDEVRNRVLACDDLGLLQRWLLRTISATSAAEIFEPIAK